MQTWKKFSIKKLVLMFCLAFLLFLILGATLPFIRPKQVSEHIRESFDCAAFYGVEGQYGQDRAAIVEDSSAALLTRFNIIEQAKERILFSSYGLNSDRSALEVCSALYAAAERGVRVEIIADAMFAGSEMRQGGVYYLLGAHPNVEIKLYNPINLLEPWNLNGRLHDKYLLIDNRFLLLGGRNTNDLFLGDYVGDRASYDREIFVYNTAAPQKEASVIQQVEEYFYTIWHSEGVRSAFAETPGLKRAEVEEAEHELMRIYAETKLTKPQLFEAVDYAALTVPTQKISLVHNPLNLAAKEPWVWYALSELMAQAEQRVLIQTPYAVLNQDMYTRLTEIAATVPQAEILLNAVSVGDNFVASADYTLNRQKIINTGFQIYEFMGARSAHNKALLIDDDISVIGSYNLDLRSTYIDTETMIVVAGKEFNQLLTEKIAAMQAQALPVLADGSYGENGDVEAVPLPLFKRILYGICSILFQPIRYLI